jgi:hypothetical protein
LSFANAARNHSHSARRPLFFAFTHAFLNPLVTHRSASATVSRFIANCSPYATPHNGVMTSRMSLLALAFAASMSASALVPSALTNPPSLADFPLAVACLTRTLRPLNSHASIASVPLMRSSIVPKTTNPYRHARRFFSLTRRTPRASNHDANARWSHPPGTPCATAVPPPAPGTTPSRADARASVDVDAGRVSVGAGAAVPGDGSPRALVGVVLARLAGTSVTTSSFASRARAASSSPRPSTGAVITDDDATPHSAVITHDDDDDDDEAFVGERRARAEESVDVARRATRETAREREADDDEDEDHDDEANDRDGAARARGRRCRR